MQVPGLVWAVTSLPSLCLKEWTPGLVLQINQQQQSSNFLSTTGACAPKSPCQWQSPLANVPQTFHQHLDNTGRKVQTSTQVNLVRGGTDIRFPWKKFHIRRRSLHKTKGKRYEQFPLPLACHLWKGRVSKLIHWCFKPSQPQRLRSGLKQTFIK